MSLWSRLVPPAKAPVRGFGALRLCCRRREDFGPAAEARPPCRRRSPSPIPSEPALAAPPKAMSSSPDTKLKKAVKTYPFWSVPRSPLADGAPHASLVGMNLRRAIPPAAGAPSPSH